MAQSSRESKRKWRLKNPEYAANYVATHRDAIRENHRRHVAKNPERRKRSSLEWSQKNIEKRRERYYANRAKAMLYQARARAGRQGIPFNLEISDIVIPTICPVLGIEIALRASGCFNHSSPSLDRVIPALGYVKGNVRVISNRANILKRDGTADELSKVALWLAAETARVKAGG